MRLVAVRGKVWSVEAGSRVSKDESVKVTAYMSMHKCHSQATLVEMMSLEEAGLPT